VVIERNEVRIQAGDTTLRGTLVVPPGDRRRPWALLVGSWLPRTRDGDWDRVRHPAWFAPAGAGAPRGVLARLADALAERGVASLRVDPRGCGASDGDWERASLFTRIDDARDAIGAMRSRPELDLRRTAIVGHGEGGTVALSVAIGDPAIGVVGLIGASARSLRSVVRAGVAERSRTGADREHPIVAALDQASEELVERADRGDAALDLALDGHDVVLELAPWEQGFRTPPVALATMLHRSVVLLHADDDAWSDVEESRLLAATLRDGGNDPLLHVVDRGGHDLAGGDDAILDRFADDLVARMAPRELPPVLVAIEEMGGGR
jgi:pimeloyl-ACP methyl ester carboxylesterase